MRLYSSENGVNWFKRVCHIGHERVRKNVAAFEDDSNVELERNDPPQRLPPSPS